jgi:hypothetical protein
MNYQGVWGVNRLAAVSLLCALLAFTTGCSTVSGWFSDDEVDPTAPVELTKIEQKVKIKKLTGSGPF